VNIRDVESGTHCTEDNLLYERWHSCEQQGLSLTQVTLGNADMDSWEP
jgi:hypothetical protein